MALVHGPVEAALAARLPRPGLEVERSAPSAPAEFRIDTRELAPDELKPFAAEVEVLDGVESAFVMGPRVYVRLTTDCLLSTVAEAAAAAGRTYGWTDAGGGAPVVSSICCPNANKPLHVGHLRNCFLGYAVSRLFETQGHSVLRTEELANYGIHVCQALAAYLRWGEGGDPYRDGVKADHWVGSWYTRFHREREADPSLDDEAADLLRRMDAGDAELLAVNERFTEWAIEGIRRTYERIGLRHDFVLRELEALPVALELIEKGLASGACLRREDGSVYVDLTGEGLGEVTLVRQDGTPLAIVMFVAIWVRRAQLHPDHAVVRITGEQWREGFLQFLGVLRRLGEVRTADLTEGTWYGMIRAADGKIRSREGTDAGADAMLDLFRDRLLAAWAEALPGRPEAYHRETCERLSVALVKWHILGKRREDTFTYDDEDVWANTLPRLARVAAALYRADDVLEGSAQPAPARTGQKTDRIRRELAVALNTLPFAFARGLARRDSAELAGYVEDVARKARDADRLGGADAATWRAVSVVLRNALWALDVTLPSSGRDLPPPFRVTQPR